MWRLADFQVALTEMLKGSAGKRRTFSPVASRSHAGSYTARQWRTFSPVASRSHAGADTARQCPEAAHVPPSGWLKVMWVCTVAPVMFGKPLLNNVLAFDHVQLQK